VNSDQFSEFVVVMFVVMFVVVALATKVCSNYVCSSRFSD